ncbi:MAG TPA: sugar transferase [Planctomycetota bacterium]|jgi:sugar transferase (PEP-CTERM system associated)
MASLGPQVVSAVNEARVSAGIRDWVSRRPRLGGDLLKLMPIAGDTLLAALSFTLIGQLQQDGEYSWLKDALYVLMLVLALFLHEMYGGVKQRRTSELITALVGSLGLTLLMIAPVTYVMPGIANGFSLLALVAVQFLLLLSWRSLLERGVIPHFGRQRVLIVGAGSRARRIREALQQKGTVIFEVIGCTADREEESASDSFRRVGASRDLAGLVQREQIDHVVVAQDNSRNVFPAADLLQLKQSGVAVSEGEYMYERLMGKLLTDYVRPSVLIFASSPMHHTLQIWTKNAIDFIVALLLLIVTLPVTITVAILIKLTSRGPIIYKQQRVGLGGKVFTIYKFRSMCSDAEKDGVRWAATNDSRVTPVGRFMRRARIDELPQLINVLKGDMSMVGPRPERPQFVDQLKRSIPFYDLRHTMRPGLSGWAQVRYRYGSSIEDAQEKLRYDLYYIKNYSLFLDLTILLETTKVVIFGWGAR